MTIFVILYLSRRYSLEFQITVCYNFLTMQRNAIDIYLGDDLRPPEPTKPVYRFGHWV